MVHDERTPLLRNFSDNEDTPPLSDFPSEDPRAWRRWRKLANIAVIASMSILSPLASSMFTPGIAEIAADLQTTPTHVIATTTGFVVMLGVGPLILAPLSETFGRRNLYLICFSVFAVLQIPMALAPNIAFLIAVRSVSGFFGSEGIANGGGTISDMFAPNERASVFGWYLLGPLLGPTLGALFGGIIVMHLGWRWIFWILTIVCTTTVLAASIFLRETYAPVLLARLQRSKETEENNKRARHYRFPDADSRPLRQKIAHSLTRPPKIFMQPIVATMSVYQALLFGTTYSIYTNMQSVYGSIYHFNTAQVGLCYLAPGLGFLSAVWFLVPRIDSVYNALTRKHGGIPKPEYRLPLANIGTVCIPVSLFAFAWAVEKRVHWFASLVPTFFYGVGQVMILNCTQNYYIDSFEAYAASAIAAGSVFGSVVGGVVPLAAPGLFERLGYGWGISVFGFLGLVLAPAPVVFYVVGERLRERLKVEL